MSGNTTAEAQSLPYARVHDGTDGETHFADAQMELEPTLFAPPAPPIAVSDPLSPAAVVFFGVPEGWFGDFHPAPHRQFCLVTTGQLELQTSDGEVRRFSPGDILLLDDVGGRGHSTRAVGSAPAAGAFVQLRDTRDS